MLTLIGAPLNVIAFNMAPGAGYEHTGFSEFAVARITMLLGTAAIILLFGRCLLPECSCILVGGMIPLATAMSQIGAAELIAEALVDVVGGTGPLALLAGLFIVTAVL